MTETNTNHTLHMQDTMAPSIRLGAIAFVNTIPIYTALPPTSNYELIFAPPATLNQMINRHELDISPVSSAYYLQHQDELVLLNDLSVSSPGAVESVLFLSRYKIDSPEFIEQQRIIPIPDDSETSINLLAWLLEQTTSHELRSRFHVMPANEYQQTLSQYGAALIIGDNALRIHETPDIFPNYHIYDLSSEWVKQTQLPFVFAVWVARKSWAEQYPEALAHINSLLVQSRQQFFENAETFQRGLTEAKKRCNLPEESLQHYFTKALTYTLEPSHYQALKQFSTILSTYQHMPTMAISRCS